MTMGSVAVYLIKSALLLAVMFAAYKLSGSRLKCASLRRGVLLAIYAVSLAAPFAGDLLATAGTDGDFGDVVVVGVGTIVRHAPGIFSWVNAALIAMAAGTCIAAFMTLTGLLWIAKCRIFGRSIPIGDLQVRVVSSPRISPFSFGGHIFLSEADFEKHDAMVLAHEASHVRHRHYIDLLIGRIVAIAQWWNPTAWIMLRELQNVHEYQADEDVIAQGFSVRDYQYLLLRKTVGSRFQMMADCLNHTPLESRLKMLNRRNSTLSSRLMMTLCVPALILGMMATGSGAFAAYMRPLENAFYPYPDKILVFPSSTRTASTGTADTPDMHDPAVMIDGKIVDNNAVNDLKPQDIKYITVLKNSEEYPDGLMIINLKR